VRPEDGNPNRPDLGDPYRLYNVADRIPTERAFSRIYRNRRELIDHIMISRPLLLAGVTADAFVDDLVGITEDVDSRRDAVRPDHARAGQSAGGVPDQRGPIMTSRTSPIGCTRSVGAPTGSWYSAWSRQSSTPR
jgi:hypothetical protein